MYVLVKIFWRKRTHRMHRKNYIKKLSQIFMKAGKFKDCRMDWQAKEIQKCKHCNSYLRQNSLLL